MKNKLLIVGICTALLPLSVFAFSKPFFLSQSNSSGGKTIYTANVITPNGAKINADEVILYGGVSTTAPCSDLSVKFDGHASAQNRLTLTNGPHYVTSDQISNFIGSKESCFKQDIVYKGKTYSTGNIKLTWDESSQQYVGANPSSSTIDFTS